MVVGFCFIAGIADIAGIDDYQPNDQTTKPPNDYMLLFIRFMSFSTASSAGIFFCTHSFCL